MVHVRGAATDDLGYLMPNAWTKRRDIPVIDTALNLLILAVFLAAWFGVPIFLHACAGGGYLYVGFGQSKFHIKVLDYD